MAQISINKINEIRTVLFVNYNFIPFSVEETNKKITKLKTEIVSAILRVDQLQLKAKHRHTHNQPNQ